MTTPRQNPSQFLDAGNPLLSAGPARLDGGVITTPQGKLGCLTVRTSSTTTTVLVEADDLRKWAQFISDLADQADGGGTRLIAASAIDAAALDATMRGSVKSLHWGHVRGSPAARRLRGVALP